MSRPRGPVVSEQEALFAVPAGDLRGVALAHELRRPREVPFTRRGRRFELRFPRPEVDRLEYLLEIDHGAGRVERVLDPTNPRRAPGAFGEKSVVEFPGYAPPDWVADEEAATGELRPLELRTRRVRARFEAYVWTPAEHAPDEPLPLLVVHDGPEYAEYSSLLRLLDHLVDFGEVPPLRALLLPPPPGRDEAYSASTRDARVLTEEIIPAVNNSSRRPVLAGASLGALAALHAHWLRPGTVGGLFLQSGSFFRRRFDAHESGFPRFARIARFVSSVHGGRAEGERIPVTITCGTGEENLDNNRALADALARRGWDVRTAWHPDAHNWISWRDSLHPHLAELLLRAWT